MTQTFDEELLSILAVELASLYRDSSSHYEKRSISPQTPQAGLKNRQTGTQKNVLNFCDTKKIGWEGVERAHCGRYTFTRILETVPYSKSMFTTYESLSEPKAPISPLLCEVMRPESWRRCDLVKIAIQSWEDVKLEAKGQGVFCLGLIKHPDCISDAAHKKTAIVVAYQSSAR